MAETFVEWELTVYAPKSEDPTETTVLTPRAGSPHSDPFVVRTKTGTVGTKPYLGLPKGRTGGIDAVTKRTTTGNLTLEVFDPRITAGGSNASRWSTAFIGDLFGRPRLKGCKWILKRELNGGAMTTYQTGRIRNVSTAKPLWLTLDVKDFADDLTRPVFTGAPHASVASYAAPPALLPLGVSQGWGNLAVTSPLSGTLTKRVAGANGAPDEGDLALAAPASPADAMVTKALLDAGNSDMPRIVQVTIVSSGATAYFRWPSTQETTKLAADGRTMVSGREYVITGGPVKHYGVQQLPVWTLPTTDTRYTVFPAAIGTGVAVTVRVFLDAPPTKATPILIGDVHPVQLWADLVDGKYSRTYDYDAPRPLTGRDTSGGGPWATLIADPSFGLMRDVVDQQWKGSDYIEKVICQRYNLAYYFDEQGRVVPVDLRRTASLAGVPTLTDDDLVADIEPSWDDSRDGAITALVYDYQVDTRLNAPDLVGSSDTYPDVVPALVSSQKSSVLIPNDLSTFRDVGEKIVTIDARGTRVSSGDWLTAHFGRIRLDRVRAELAQAGRDFLRPFGAGQLTATVTYRAASTLAAAVRPGSYRIVNHAKLPNPATNQRGGARLMLALSVNDVSAGRIAIQWLDAGEGSVAVAPVISAIAAASATALDVTVALNAASDPVDVWVAATATSVGTRPADNAAEWVFAKTVTASSTVRVTSLPGSKRIWVRAQAHGAGANVKLPSVWAYPPAPGYIDLGAAGAIDNGTAAADNPPLSGAVTYNQCDARITAEDADTVTVTVTASAPSGTPTVQLVAVTGSATLVSGAAIGTPVASGSTWVFKKGASLAGVGEAQFRAVFAGNVSDDDFVPIPEKTADTALGQQILLDPAFALGLTYPGTYDNFASGHVHLSVVVDATAPNASGKFLRINVDSSTTPGVTVDPGFGGFDVAIPVDGGVYRPQTYHKGAKITWRLRARIPVGYTVNWAANAFGTGASITSLTPMVGTGDWYDYKWLTVVGTSGTFSTIGFFYLTGSGTGPIQWDAAQLTANDANQSPREAVRLQSRARVISSSATAVVVRYAVADPFPSGLADVTIAYDAVGTGGVTPSSGGTVTPASTLTEAAGTYIDYTITRPAFTAGTGRVTFTASRTGYTSDSDAVDIPAQEKTSFGPSIDGSSVLTSTSMTLTWTSVGTLTLKVDGVSTSVPSSPHVITLDAANHSWDFLASLDSQTFPWSVFVPSTATTPGSDPAFSSVGLTPWTSAAYAGAGTTTMRAQWAMSSPPTGVTYDLVFEEQVTATAFAVQRVYGVTSPYDFTTQQLFVSSGGTTRTVRLTVIAIVGDTVVAQSRTEETTFQVF